MEARTNLLILSRDFSLFDAIRKAAPAESVNVFFCQPEEDYPSLMREHAFRIAFIDPADAGKEAQALLKKMKSFDPLLDVVVIGENAGSESILNLIGRGAVDYLIKPLSAGTISRVLDRIGEKRALRRETLQLEKKLEKKYAFQGLISRNPAMLEVFSLIENIAQYFTSVLVTGETGTGKELVARAVHALSPAKDARLVICDCT
jgi:DNA-binding NtrC family response regulator